ncbi:hypothetical protein HJ116_02530 [Vibrio parahaemolyticus]|nr:hypothetical protein [Vibrio parahaemolyticus]
MTNVIKAKQTYIEYSNPFDTKDWIIEVADNLQLPNCKLHSVLDAETLVTTMKLLPCARATVVDVEGFKTVYSVIFNTLTGEVLAEMSLREVTTVDLIRCHAVIQSVNKITILVENDSIAHYEQLGYHVVDKNELGTKNVICFLRLRIKSQ